MRHFWGLICLLCFACTTEEIGPPPPADPCTTSAAGGLGVPEGFTVRVTPGEFVDPFGAIFQMADATTGYVAEGGLLNLPNRLHRTDDAGETWTVLPNAPQGVPLFFNWLSADWGWLVTWQERDDRTRIWRTTDGGDTWTFTEPLGLVGGELWELMQDESGHYYGLFSDYDRLIIVHSEDDGESWAPLYTTTGLQRSFLVQQNLRYDQNVLYVPAEASSVRRIRTDGTALPGIETGAGPGLGRPLLIDGDDWLVATDAGIYRTVDGGGSWTLVDDASVFPLFQREDELWVGETLNCPNSGSGTDRMRLAYSSDRGQTWQRSVTSTAQLSDFRFDAAGSQAFLGVHFLKTYHVEAL